MIVTNKIVVIKKIARPNWMGFSSYPKSSDTIVPTLGRGGLYKTGLTPEEETELESLLNLSTGTLARTSEYWTNVSLRFNNQKAELNLASPSDIIKYKFATENKLVAESKSKITPYSQYVIEDEEAEAKKDNVKINYKRKAYVIFGKLSTDEMRNALKLYGKRKPEGTSNEVIENTLALLLEQDPELFLKVMEDPKLKIKVIIQDAITYFVIRKNGSHYLYQDEPIGHDLESAILFLEDPKNANVLGTILKAIDKGKNK